MKKTSLIILALSLNLFCFAQIKHTVTKGRVTYQIKNMGFTSSGIFGGLEATILFDKAHLDKSTITASVATKTVDSDDDMRDAHLKREDYFDAEHYPKIVLKSVSFKAAGGNNFVGQFDLTIKGITKRVELTFTYTVKGKTATFNGSFKMNRLDFNIGDHSMVLSNEATILLDVETVF